MKDHILASIVHIHFNLSNKISSRKMPTVIPVSPATQLWTSFVHSLLHNSVILVYSKLPTLFILSWDYSLENIAIDVFLSDKIVMIQK